MSTLCCIAILTRTLTDAFLEALLDIRTRLQKLVISGENACLNYENDK